MFFCPRPNPQAVDLQGFEGYPKMDKYLKVLKVLLKQTGGFFEAAASFKYNISRANTAGAKTL